MINHNFYIIIGITLFVSNLCLTLAKHFKIPPVLFYLIPICHVILLAVFDGLFIATCLVICNLVFKPSLDKLTIKVIVYIITFFIYSHYDTSHILHLIFYYNMISVNTHESYKVLYGESFGKLFMGAKGFFSPILGQPIENKGYSSVILLLGGAISADQSSKNSKLNQIQQRIDNLHTQVDFFKYENPSFEGLNKPQKEELFALKKSLAQENVLYQNQGGVLYSSLENMTTVFTEKFL